MYVWVWYIMKGPADCAGYRQIHYDAARNRGEPDHRACPGRVLHLALLVSERVLGPGPHLRLLFRRLYPEPVFHPTHRERRVLQGTRRRQF